MWPNKIYCPPGAILLDWNFSPDFVVNFFFNDIFSVEIYLQHKSQHPLQSQHSDPQCSQDHQCQNHLTMRALYIMTQGTGHLFPPAPPRSELKIDRLSLTNIYIPRVVLLFVHILVADRRFPEDFKPEVKHKRRGR